MRKRLRAYWSRALAILYGPDRTIALEWALASTMIWCGLWVLSPAWQSFSAFTILDRLPEPLIGGLMFAQGMAHVAALEHGSVRWARWHARAAGIMWASIAGTFALVPPHTLLIVAVTSALAGMAMAVWLRLWLRFP